MTNKMNDLEDELNDLDIPIVMLDAALMVMGDAFDIDPLDIIDAMIGGEGTPIDDLRTAHGANDVNLMIDILSEGLESSTQLPHIRRAIELHALLAE